LVAVKVYVVVDAGLTEALPLSATFPIPGPMVTEVAPLVAQVKVWGTADDAEKEVMAGGVPTTTVVCPVTVPLGFMAVKVYVVVEAGLTEALPVSATLPIPGVMVTEVAPLVAQVKVWGTAVAPDELRADTFSGLRPGALEDVKDVIVGGAGVTGGTGVAVD